MIENRHPVSVSLNPLANSGAEPPWAGRESSPKQVESRGRRILIVDDEATLRACLRMMLEFEGHQVSEATNGAEALNLFNLGEFDLVITDFEMPVMQGNQLAVRLKLLAPSLPILMVTGSGRARRDSRNPVDAVLSKPFTGNDLRSVLRNLLSPQQESDQASVVPALESPSVTFTPEGQMAASLPA